MLKIKAKLIIYSIALICTLISTMIVNAAATQALQNRSFEDGYTYEADPWTGDIHRVNTTAKSGEFSNILESYYEMIYQSVSVDSDDMISFGVWHKGGPIKIYIVYTTASDDTNYCPYSSGWELCEINGGFPSNDNVDQIKIESWFTNVYVDLASLYYDDGGGGPIK